MKKTIYFLGALFFGGALWGDEIYLTDSTVLEGKVLRVTANSIEYDPEGETPFLMVERYKVSKIVYSNGSVQNFSPSNSSAVNKGGKQAEYLKKPEFVYSKSSIEFELGRGYVGAGLRYNTVISPMFAMNIGVGLSGWGYRLGGALRYLVNGPLGPQIAIGASYSLGLPEYEYNYDVIDPISGNVSNEKVIIIRLPVATVNLSVIKSWRLSSLAKFYVELGYAHRVTEKTYEVTSGHVLSDESKSFAEFYEPGGMIFSFGISRNM